MEVINGKIMAKLHKHAARGRKIAGIIRSALDHVTCSGCAYDLRAAMFSAERFGGMIEELTAARCGGRCAPHYSKIGRQAQARREAKLLQFQLRDCSIRLENPRFDRALAELDDAIDALPTAPEAEVRESEERARMPFIVAASAELKGR